MSQLVDGNDDAETDDTEGSGPSGGTTTPHMYVPPGARAAHCFGEDFEGHFSVPARLQDKSADLVEAVNDFHYAMINDHPRNEFYRECLRRAIVPGESVVLEIGTGSGLLAMLAARLGPRMALSVGASCSSNFAAMSTAAMRTSSSVKSSSSTPPAGSRCIARS